MTEIANRQWTLAKRPQGIISASDFAFGTASVPSIADGEVLVRTLYLSSDPLQRIWLGAVGLTPQSVSIGSPVIAFGIGQVVESRNVDIKRGEILQGVLSWSDYIVLKPDDLAICRKVTHDMPLTWNMTIIGETALAAYYGMALIGRPKPTDVVLVSGAAGATGSVAGQVARLKGASRIVGIVGNAEKAKWLVDVAKFDAAVDHRTGDLADLIRSECPDRVDVFFDNIGGNVLEAGIANIAERARIVICGAISGYNSLQFNGPRNYMELARLGARMEGVNLSHHSDHLTEAQDELIGWARSGDLRIEESVTDGLENAPSSLLSVFEGSNIGKAFIKVSDADK